MLEINCIKHIFGYLLFSPNTFPKIWQKLGGQLRIRLSVLHVVHCLLILYIPNFIIACYSCTVCYVLCFCFSLYIEGAYFIDVNLP